jgi:ParB-like chromosome segregation protein Spo0J
VGDNSLMKLELAIIENLQREDLNVVERARAFIRFVEEFHYVKKEVLSLEKKYYETIL